MICKCGKPSEIRIDGISMCYKCYILEGIRENVTVDREYE